jgi:hypothetical protein
MSAAQGAGQLYGVTVLTRARASLASGSPQRCSRGPQKRRDHLDPQMKGTVDNLASIPVSPATYVQASSIRWLSIFSKHNRPSLGDEHRWPGD